MAASSVIRKAHYASVLLLIVYPVLLALLTIPWCQKQLIFLHWVNWPFNAKYDNPEVYGLAPYKTRNFRLNTTDGESLGVWHILPKSTYQALDPFPPRQTPSGAVFEQSLRHRPTILYFHGNASIPALLTKAPADNQAANRAASHRVRGYSAYSALDCNVLAIDYRGFGDSTGSPWEKGLIRDAKAVWDYVHSHGSQETAEGTNGPGVVLVGQSLGTGVVAGLAGLLAGQGVHPRAVVLIAPFTSITELLDSFWLFGLIPLLSPLKAIPFALEYFKSFIAYPFDSALALTKTSSPVLILHARDDDVIPHHHSSILFSTLQTEADAKVERVEYEQWGTIASFSRTGKGEVIWWDGLKGGHNDIGWAEGSVDLVRRIVGL